MLKVVMNNDQLKPDAKQRETIECLNTFSLQYVEDEIASENFKYYGQ